MNWTPANALVCVRPSGIHGHGLFAAQKLQTGQWIGHYRGLVVEEDGMHVLWIEDNDARWLGYRGLSSMRFLNHSDTPNAEMRGLDCYALKEIPPGREITIDYGWGEEPALSPGETDALD